MMREQEASRGQAEADTLQMPGPPTPRQDLGHILQALLAALKLREGKANDSLTEITVQQDLRFPQFTNVFMIYKKKAFLAITSLPEGNSQLS